VLKKKLPVMELSRTVFRWLESKKDWTWRQNRRRNLLRFDYPRMSTTTPKKMGVAEEVKAAVTHATVPSKMTRLCSMAARISH